MIIRKFQIGLQMFTFYLSENQSNRNNYCLIVYYIWLLSVIYCILWFLNDKNRYWLLFCHAINQSVVYLAKQFSNPYVNVYMVFRSERNKVLFGFKFGQKPIKAVQSIVCSQTRQGAFLFTSLLSAQIIIISSFSLLF